MRSTYPGTDIDSSELLAVANHVKPLTCATCRHWHKMPRPKIQTPDGPATDMGAQVTGECRRTLRSLPLAHPDGRFAYLAYYQPTPENFSACGDYEER